MSYRIYSVNHPGALVKFLDLESGCLFEVGAYSRHLLNFHRFQQV